ncbi:MutS domain III [Pedobacter steynii]|uniref:MutS domain III n=1 Tax=Pedobacter steynii TaxID=430522 RepID=A0A1G9PBH9_9SPHI|nr:DNA mismatch repair protein [Pedobacter steynii]NQX39033.1 DNA mismatch repair protein [Pedobacter steynii]SDL96120.1 MutS domain III [Pedobacter steynii]
MLFTTDKQTLEDLNIFGKHGGESLYNIFNCCATRGGAAILEDMFRYPLSDETAINKRCGTFLYFKDLNVKFHFESVLFDAVEPYMANTDERTKLSAQEYSVIKKLSNIIAVEVETQQIYDGINSLVTLLRRLEAFTRDLDIYKAHPYYAEKSVITGILTEPVIVSILERKDKLTHNRMVELDVLLRFQHRDLILNLLRQIYLLDVYFSVARVAKERGFAFPKALPREERVIRLDGVYHAQVKTAVPNSIAITPDSNVIFLTGANMAGKSTFMKSLSIAMFLAHMGFPVAAASLEFSVLDGIYTTINLPDNLSMGASHFYAEVLRVKKIAQELSQDKHLFIVFDELFRGTNVKDAYEATIAITKGFARKKNSTFVISTHIIEAGDVLRTACPNVRFVYLPTRMNGNLPVYTYTLENGITDDRHGMIIINNEGILDILKKGRKGI